jgi:catechol 2,3-dioxygenase-like lactoylglutathione lyase family enzyme
MMAPRILETALYAHDLVAARHFYEHVLGLECYAVEEGRHVFFKCGDQMLLIFDPRATAQPRGTLPVPPHGARGPGHICFRASSSEFDGWRRRLEFSAISIEAEFEWPGGGRSLYIRDPAGNSVEFAEPRIWNLQ